MTTKVKNPGSSKDPDVCTHPNLEHDDLTKEAEKKRRADRDKKMKELKQGQRKHTYDARRAAEGGDLPKAATANKDLEDVNNALQGLEFEKKVGDKAVWTSIKYRCPDCGLSGEIDAVMKSGAAKECKSNGKPKKAQYTRYRKVCSLILGGTPEVHIAVPAGMRGTAERSMKDQPGLNAQVQEH